jgi:hypothetical protein
MTLITGVAATPANRRLDALALLEHQLDRIFR